MKTVKVHVATGPEIEEARRTVEDVLELLNRHFRTRGVEFVSADVAMTLNNLAILHSDTQRMSEAEAEFGEALALNRKLAEADPETYDVHLARTLLSHALFQVRRGNLQEALTEAEEAKAMCEQQPDRLSGPLNLAQRLIQGLR